MWCTINEPNIYAANGWITGEFPPAHRGDLAGSTASLATCDSAHELAYAAIKRRWPDTPVGLSHHKFLFLPASSKRRDRLAARTAQFAVDRWPVGPGRLRRVVEATSDFIGIAHYWAQMCAFDPRRPRDQFIRRFNVPGAQLTDMGWSADPVWMRRVLNELKGLGQAGLHHRERAGHRRRRAARSATSPTCSKTCGWRSRTASTSAATSTGRTWTTSSGRAGTRRQFGLIEVDRKTLERTIKPSGRLYGRIAGANALPEQPLAVD